MQCAVPWLSTCRESLDERQIHITKFRAKSAKEATLQDSQGRGRFCPNPCSLVPYQLIASHPILRIPQRIWNFASTS